MTEPMLNIGIGVVEVNDVGLHFYIIFDDGSRFFSEERFDTEEEAKEAGFKWLREIAVTPLVMRQ